MKDLLIILIAWFISPRLGLSLLILFLLAFIGRNIKTPRRPDSLKVERGRQRAALKKADRQQREAERDRRELERMEEQAVKKDAARFQAKETIKHYTVVLEELQKQLEKLDIDIKYAALAQEVDNEKRYRADRLKLSEKIYQTQKKINAARAVIGE